MEVEHIISLMPEVYPARKFEYFVKVEGEMQKFDSFDVAEVVADKVGEDVEQVEIDTEETDKKLASYEKLIEEFEQAYDLKYSHLPKWFRDGLYEASFYEVKRGFGEGGNPQMFHRAFVVKIEANYTQLIGSLCS